MSRTNKNSEIEKFSRDAPRWWDEDGPFKPLHRLNPARMQYIKTQICNHYNLDYNNLKALKDLNILDIGCGGGLVCEPLARLGATVTGIDGDDVAIQIAKDHATQSGLKINYRVATAENILSTDNRQPITEYDIVLALEIIEHIDNPSEFVKTTASLVKPGGIIIFSTLNRTPKSYLLGIVAAEYILRWVPRGTHEWSKFLRPSELAKLTKAQNLEVTDITGLIFNPLKNDFTLSKTDLDVNYFITTHRPKI
jgi:2-polyprenyl-6-hydroxyphenyl methylase/3-demethylubiquinone-9 3-methyltransferase